MLNTFSGYDAAVRAVEEDGGYLLRTGTDGEYMVLDRDDFWLIPGFRDWDAYGIDLRIVSEEAWATALWDETRLANIQREDK